MLSDWAISCGSINLPLLTAQPVTQGTVRGVRMWQLPLRGASTALCLLLRLSLCLRLHPTAPLAQPLSLCLREHLIGGAQQAAIRGLRTRIRFLIVASRHGTQARRLARRLVVPQRVIKVFNAVGPLLRVVAPPV